MDDDAAFLRAIRDRPDDDLPRLIYADYLDERGQPARAEFIRVGCERARVSARSYRHRQLVERELELLADNQEDWERVIPGALSVRYARGFPSVIELEARSFVGGNAAFLSCCPAAEVRIRNVWEELEFLLKLPYALGILAIDVSDNALTDDDIERLLAAPWIRELKSLNLSRNRFGPVAARAIARTPKLVNIENLALDGNAIACTGAASLAGGRHFARLRSLNLRNAEIRADGVAALANASGLPALETLDLRGNAIGANGVRSLLMSAKAPGWKRLRLREDDVTHEQAQQLRERFGATIELS